MGAAGKESWGLEGVVYFWGFLSFFFFFPVITTVRKRACREGAAYSVIPNRYTLDLGSKKTCDLKQPNIWFFMLVEQALHSFPTLCSDLTLLSNCKVFLFHHPTSPLSLDYRPCLSTSSFSVPFLPLGSLVFLYLRKLYWFSSGTKWPHVCASHGDQPERLCANKGLIQNIVVTEIIQVGIDTARRSWLFWEWLLWYILIACVFRQTCSVPGTAFNWHPGHFTFFFFF